MGIVKAILKCKQHKTENHTQKHKKQQQTIKNNSNKKAHTKNTNIKHKTKQQKNKNRKTNKTETQPSLDKYQGHILSSWYSTLVFLFFLFSGFRTPSVTWVEVRTNGTGGRGQYSLKPKPTGLVWGQGQKLWAMIHRTADRANSETNINKKTHKWHPKTRKTTLQFLLHTITTNKKLETQQKKNTFCSDPSMKGFRDDLKLNVIWKYRDLSGRVIGNIKLNYLDCKE